MQTQRADGGTGSLLLIQAHSKLTPIIRRSRSHNSRLLAYNNQRARRNTTDLISLYQLPNTTHSKQASMRSPEISNEDSSVIQKQNCELSVHSIIFYCTSCRLAVLHRISHNAHYLTNTVILNNTENSLPKLVTLQ